MPPLAHAARGRSRSFDEFRWDLAVVVTRTLFQTIELDEGKILFGLRSSREAFFPRVDRLTSHTKPSSHFDHCEPGLNTCLLELPRDGASFGSGWHALGDYQKCLTDST